MDLSLSTKQKLVGLALLDVVLSFVSLNGAFLLRQTTFSLLYFSDFAAVFPVVVLSRLACLRYFGMYNRMWRYASVKEIVTFLQAVGLSLLLTFSVLFVLHGWHLQAPVIIIDTMLSVLLLGGARTSVRIYRDSALNYSNKGKKKRVLVIGAGDTGIIVAKQLFKGSEYLPIGFVDDDVRKIGKNTLNLPIMGPISSTKNFIDLFAAECLIISIRHLSGHKVREIVNLCEDRKISFQIIPNIDEIIDGRVTLNHMRPVLIEDLLRRKPIQLDIRAISQYVTNRIVLIPGAGGSIGSELCRQIARYNPKQLLLLGHGENSIYHIDMELKEKFPNLQTRRVVADIRDPAAINHVFRTFTPEIIFHAAAHKHVPLMEENPEEAILNNIKGTQNLVEAAHHFHASRFVFISTDKAVNPTNVMGASKRMAELILQVKAKKSDTVFCSVRFGNVLGSNGSVLPLFQKQLAKGEPLTVTHRDVTRYFMTIPEAVQLVIQAGALANGGEKYILDMGEPIRIYDLAKDLIRLSGLEPERDVKIKITGMRPGEKLYEELLLDKESVISTKNEKIFIAMPEKVDEKMLDEWLDALYSLATQYKSDALVKRLMECIALVDAGTSAKLPEAQLAFAPFEENADEKAVILN